MHPRHARVPSAHLGVTLRFYQVSMAHLARFEGSDRFRRIRVMFGALRVCTRAQRVPLFFLPLWSVYTRYCTSNR